MELEIFKQQVCLRKIGYANALSLGANSRKKMDCDNFEHRTSSKKKKKKSENLTGIDWNNSRNVYIASSKSSKPKILVWHLNKIGKTIFKNSNEINSTVTTRK